MCDPMLRGRDAAEVERLKEHFGVVLRLMVGALLVTDTEGIIQMANPATLRLLGYGESDLLGHPVDDLFPGREPAGHDIMGLIRRVVRERTVERVELHARTFDDERIPLEVAASPSCDADGHVLGIVLVGTDLREMRRLLAVVEIAEAERARSAELGQAYEDLKKVQQQLIHAEKMASLDRLSAGVAHEINNPLGGILTYAHLLQELLPAEGATHQYVDIIIREATRCRDIVRGLLDFARVSKGRAEPNDVNAIVRDGLALVTGQSLFHDIAVEARYAENLPRVLVDRNQVQQAFFNIIYNAAQAMAGSGGALTVDTGLARDGRRVWVRFSDTGPGIHPKHLGIIFEPFFTTKPVGEGTGLGLAVVRGIVTQNGGTIEVQSRLGEGATFTIYLPVMA